MVSRKTVTRNRPSFHVKLRTMTAARKKRPRRESLTRRFRTALANAEMTQSEWAKAHGWTDGHVSQVVSGERESDTALPKVLAFIEAQERLIAQRAAKEPAA